MAKFVDVSRRCGNGLDVVESSRGTGFDDLDKDGDVDVVVLNSQAPPTLIRNKSDTGNHWLQVQLHTRSFPRWVRGGWAKT